MAACDELMNSRLDLVHLFWYIRLNAREPSAHPPSILAIDYGPGAGAGMAE